MPVNVTANGSAVTSAAPAVDESVISTYVVAPVNVVGANAAVVSVGNPLATGVTTPV